ncbi:MAG TPA: hypothetical protein VM943_02260 [Pyrinomonadaceae bacterium]|nr:hypothetical protein [Pyrinomonadaceae bacterium]
MMNNGYSVKSADASGKVWNILDASGGQVGACSSQQQALRIATLANSGLNKSGAQTIETSPAAVNENRAVAKPIAARPQMFEWYSPDQRRAAWSYLKRILRLGTRRGARSIVSL